MEIENVAEKFARFILPLNEEFIEQSWSQELFEIDYGPYSRNDDTEERVELLIKAYDSLQRNLQSPESATEFSSLFWSQLKAHNLSQRNLLPYISYYVSSYSKNDSNVHADKVGLIVASMVLKLLSMPGAVVFDMYHQVVFDYAVDKLNLASKVQQEKSRDRAAEKWRKSVTKKVDNLLDDLTRLIRLGFLKERPLAVNTVVKKLTDLLSLDRGILIREFTGESNPSLSFRMYRILYILCHDKSNTSLVLENLMQSVALGGALGQARSQFETVSNFVQYLVRKKAASVAWQPVAVLLQQLLTRSIDRAENRLRLSMLATCLIVKLPKQLRNCVVNWVFRYLAFSERSTHRLMALEFLMHMLQEREMDECLDEEMLVDEPVDINDDEDDELEIDDPELESLVCYPFKGGKPPVKHYHIFCLVLLRVDDVAPLIRTKSLNMLADILATQHDHSPLKHIINRIFVAPYTESLELERTVTVLWANRKQFLDSIHGAEFSLPEGRKIANTLFAIAEDERVYVRKSALQTLVSMGKLSDVWMSNSLLKLLSSHCRDPAVMIRKQIITNMTDLLKAHYRTNSSVIIEWVLSVMPCLQDPESKAQEMVQENLHEIFFGNLCEYSEGLSKSKLLPWKILRLTTNHNLKKLFSDTFQLWSKQKKLPSHLVRTVKSFIDTSFNNEAWVLLAIISETQTIPDVEFAHQYYKKNASRLRKNGMSTIYAVLRVLMLNTKSLKAEQSKELKNLLCAQIEQCLLPTDLIGTVMDTIAALEVSNDQIKRFFAWCTHLWKKFESKICLYVSRPGQTAPDSSEEVKLREMTTIGDAVRLASLSNYSAKLVGSLLSVALSGDEKSNFSAKEIAFPVTPRVKAVAVIALGKLALLQEQAAFEAVRIFQHLLKVSTDNIFKCNIMTVLADLIGKYATLVDSIVNEIEMCLRDPESDMRRHALVVVVQLLQGDFVKLRGTTLLFYLLTTLCDREEDLRDMTACYLTNTLIAKEPNILQQNLMSAVFLLNAYKDHERFSKTKISSSQLRRLSLAGADNKHKRMVVYNFMLEYMSDDHRFDSLHRLCTQILGGFVDGVFSMKDDHILEDALAILSSENIRLRCMKVTSDGEVTDADEAFSKLYDHTKKMFVAQEVKNKIIENIVPIIKSLRVKLRKERSRLADDLMRFLRDFMKDFKTEIDEIFSGDKQLVEEIMFDIRQIEEQEKDPDQEQEDDDEDKDEQ